MKKVLLITLLLTLLLFTAACSNDSLGTYVNYIAEELRATKWEYTWSKTNPTKGYQIDFISIEPNQSYSIWLCKGEGAQMYCEMVLIRYL